MPADSTDADRFGAQAGGALLRWYEAEKRDLPWRRTSDPYAILVSEIMLQQTRVETVVPRYERFLQRFPTLRELAEADVDEVLAEWSGLGYYRRARSLHASARAVQDAHGGEFPCDFAALRALPGIGDYTAAAIASIAFGLPHVGIDGNVNRVLCRYFGIAASPTRVATRRRLQAAAESLLDEHPAGDVTQALIELGARVCTPRAPGCDSCCLRRQCVAAAEGTQELLPVRASQPVIEVEEAAAVLQSKRGYLLVRGQRPGVLADMWEFPTLDSRLRDTDVGEGTDLADELRAHLHRLGVRTRRLRPLGEIRHGITNRRIRCQVFVVDVDGEPGPFAGAAWYTRAEATKLPLAASATRILELTAD